MDEGTIVHIDYDLFNADSEKLIETTREEVAKEHDAHDENRTYSPMVTVIGDGRLIPGFEAHLADAEAETDYSFDIEPSEAYGERDASLVETISQNVLLRSVRDPEMLGIGSPVEIGGRTGVLQFLSAGRARIDYNHPLAGATLRYDYRITKVVEDRKEKVETLLASSAPSGTTWESVSWCSGKSTSLVRSPRKSDRIGSTSLSARTADEPHAD